MYCHNGKDKKNDLYVRKIIVNAHKGGEAYTLYQNIFKCQERTILITLNSERKLVREISKDPRTTAKTG